MGAHACGCGASLQPSPQGGEVLSSPHKTAGHHLFVTFSPQVGMKFAGKLRTHTGACGDAAAHVGGWFLAQSPGLVKFRARVCKTAGPLKCEKNSPIRIPARTTAGLRSRQGDRRNLRRQGGYFHCQEGL